MGDGEGEDDPAARFLKGFVLATGILAVSCLLLFLPVVGPLLLITAAPFAACYFGLRSSGLDTPRGWLWLGLCAGALISVVESSVLLSVIGLVGAVDPFEPVGLGLMGALFMSNMLFGALGARRAAAEGA